MPNSTMSVTDALKILELQRDNKYIKRDIDVAYRKLAKKLHPDKGGTHEQFLALSEAYQIVLGWVEHPTPLGSVKTNKADGAKVNVSLSVAEALATLYTTISTVGDKLDTYGTSENIALRELRNIFGDIQYSLRKDILDNSPEVTLEILRSNANNLNSRINNIHSGPTPAFAAIVAGTFVTIALGILVLMVALSPPAGVVLGTAVLSGLIATPPVGGLLFGTFCFFAATSAHKNRSEQQQEMRTIVTAINALADSIQQNQEEVRPSLT